MKNFIQIVLFTFCLFSGSFLHSFQFANTLRQRVAQNATWQKATQFGAAHGPKAKKFVNYADKMAVVGGLGTLFYSWHTANAMANRPTQSLMVPSKTQCLIQRTAQKMDVNFSDLDFHIVPKMNNAYAMSSLFGKNYIGIGEEILKKPLEQQEAVIAHELAHIKHNHSLKRFIPPLAISAVTFFACKGFYGSCIKGINLLQKQFCNRQFMNVVLKKIIPATLLPLTSLSLQTYALWKPGGITTHYDYDEAGNLTKVTVEDDNGLGHKLMAWFSRKQETEADITAAQLTGCANGMIKYMETQLDADPKSALEDSANENSSHPTPQQRIEYLQPFVQQEK